MIFSADELCVAAEEVLKRDLPGVLSHPFVTERVGGDYGDIATWQQLPTIEALSTARFPAIAITSSGLTQSPSFSVSENSWAGTWRLVVGVYDRGRDHADTQARIRVWCACIRSSLLRNRSLSGTADSLAWVGEEFALLPNRNQARSIAAGAVAFDVTARIPALFDPPSSGGDWPVVLTTPTSVSVRPPGGNP